MCYFCTYLHPGYQYRPPSDHLFINYDVILNLLISTPVLQHLISSWKLGIGFSFVDEVHSVSFRTTVCLQYEVQVGKIRSGIAVKCTSLT